MAQDRRHRLHHDLLRVEDAVEDDAEGLPAHLHHRHEAFRRGLVRRREAQQPRERDQRQQPVAQAQHRRILDAFDPRRAILHPAHAHQLHHADLRQGEAFAARLDDEGRDDRERQRDLDGEGRAAPFLRDELDRAADLLDVGLDHVHADAPARDRGHLLRGGEARGEDEAQHLALAHLRELGFGREAVGQRLGADLLDRQAAAVVADLDDDVPAFVIGVEQDAPRLRLAGGAALLGGFEPVVAGIAHHVRQRVADQFQHLPVQFRLRAAHLEVDLLAQFMRQVAHQARQLGPGIADRLHARLHHPFLQVGGDVRQALQRHGEGIRLVRAGQLQQLVAREDQFADQHHQVLEHVDRDADGLRGDGARTLGHRLGRGGLGRGGGGARFLGGGPGIGGGRCVGAALGGGVQGGDQRRVVAGGLRAGDLDPGHDLLHPVERGEDQRDPRRRDRERAVPVAAQHVLGGMRHRFQARQPQEPAGPLDRVDEPEDFRQRRLVVRRAFEPHQRGIERRQALMRFGQEVGQQVVHRTSHHSSGTEDDGSLPKNS